MAVARAICTCAQCGSTFEKQATKRNRTEANHWVEWAQQTFDECPDCYRKRMREEESKLPLTIEIGLNPYAHTICLIAGGNTIAYKDALKAQGYRWDYNPGTGVLGSIVGGHGKVWQKKIAISDTLDEQLRVEVEAAETLGATVENNVSPLDLQMCIASYAKQQRIQKEKEEAKAAVERPVKPEWLPEGRWNGTIYGGSKYGYSIYINGEKINITDDQKAEIERWQKQTAEYKAKIQAIEASAGTYS